MSRTRILVALLLTLSLVTAPSFAAVKAGAKCTKAGATATAGGKKFTCIKSGTKLVWNKGVAIKAAPKPEANPVLKPVEPTSTTKPTPTSPPAPKYPDAPTSFDDLIANYKGISYAAWSKSNAAITASKDVAPAIYRIDRPEHNTCIQEPSLCL
jgi:hypothetical protein